VEPLLRRHATGPTSILKDAQEKQKVVLGGLVTGFRTSVIKQGPNEGKKMAFFRLEDFAGSASCVVFSRAYAEHASRLANDRVVFVEGDVDASREEPTLRVSRVVTADEAPVTFARGLLVRLADAGPATLATLKGVLQAHAGPLPVAVELHPDPRRRVIVRAGPSWCVAASEGTLAAVAGVPGVRAAEWTSRDL
jgi:DNA polymerase-3 subunit alpha